MTRRGLVYGAGTAVGLWLLTRSKSAPAVVRSATGSPAGSMPSGYLSNRFDRIFQEECRGIPVEYLRALAYQESRMDPGDTGGGCWGLLQVCPTVLRSYNERFGTDWTRGEEMLEADKNARVACELIARIPRFYVSRHPGAFPGGFSWRNRRHVDLLTQGWNAGWSERTGVSGAIGFLRNAGYAPEEITAARISRFSSEGKLPDRFTKLLGSRGTSWIRKVSALYFRELRALSS